jgi:hypothetical protein
MSIAVSRPALLIHAVAAVGSSVGGFGCGGKVNIVVASDAATGGNVVDQVASAGVDGSGLSSSSGAGSGSGGGPGSTSSSSGSSGGPGSTGTSSGSGGSCATTCTNGCCDSTSACRSSGDDTCGFLGATCSDCTATGTTCVYGKCVGEAGAGPRCEPGPGVAVSPDAGACLINFSQYDRSCSSDSDCVSTVTLPCAVYTNGGHPPAVYVRGGNFCDGCNCSLELTISQSAVAQYIADVSKTPEGSGQVEFPICMCAPPPPSNPKCMNGSCVL